MGGFGSGRWQRGKATTVEFNALDVRRLQRDGLLTLGNAFTCTWVGGGETVAAIRMKVEAERLILEYRCSSGDDWKSTKYGITLESTNCRFGGKRAWLRCPANGCGKRVALLYLGGSGIFACRHCYNLGYASQKKNVGDRAKARAEKIREHLGWQGSIAHSEGDKPKGLHWETFFRLVDQHDNFAEVAIAEAMQKTRRRLGIDAA